MGCSVALQVGEKGVVCGKVEEVGGLSMVEGPEVGGSGSVEGPGVGGSRRVEGPGGVRGLGRVAGLGGVEGLWRVGGTSSPSSSSIIIKSVFYSEHTI